MKILKLITAAFLLAGFSASLAKAETVSRTVSAGKTSPVFIFYVFDSEDCRATPFPKTRVKKSKNGQLSYKKTPFKIRPGNTCAGKTVNAVTVYYTPNRGFRGKDKGRFGFNYAKFVDGEGHQYYGVTANINVK